MSTLKLYRHALSGHAHRVELFLSLIGKEAQLIDVDLLAGAHKADAFLALNPFGQVPVIEDGGTVVYDSNAILVYLAKTYADARWLPEEPEAAAEVKRWLALAAGPIANGPGAARLVTLFGADLDIGRAHAIAEQFFHVLDAHLDGRQFLVGENATIADVAAYAYIARAPEGNISLAPYPNIRAWLERVEGLDGFVPFAKSNVGLNAA